MRQCSLMHLASYLMFDSQESLESPKEFNAKRKNMETLGRASSMLGARAYRSMEKTAERAPERLILAELAITIVKPCFKDTDHA